MPIPLLLGHRGARREASENTLEAFELCLQHGCDGFEFDVRLTADHRCAVCHDANIGRRDVATTRFADLGTPCLEDVLTGVAERAFLDIELKVSGLEQAVIDALGSHPPLKGYFVSSFLPNVVEELYKRDRTLKLGLICRTRTQLAAWTALPIQALFLERGLCSAGLIDALHTAGKRVFVWTVNSQNEMRTFADLGVDGIISDDTALLAKTFASRSGMGAGAHQER